MLTASQDFHLATVQANPNEHILFAFHQDVSGLGDPPSILNTVMFWTGADVNARTPVRITETANPNTELSIGQAPSATLSCEIFNERGLLTHYLMQEAYNTDCSVYLGVETASNPIPHDIGDANCIAYIDTAHSLRVTGHSTAPYIRLNGSEMPITYQQQSNAITWPVKAIIVDTGASETGPVIVAIGDNLKYCAIQWEEGETWGDLEGAQYTWAQLANLHYTWGNLLGSGTGNGFSVSYWNYYYKFPQIAASGNGYSRHGNTIYVTTPDGIETKIEYLPVGVFRMNAPTQIDEYSCAFTAYDKMTMFDVDIADWLENDVSYPIDLDILLTELCEHIGVGLHTTTAMLNYDLSIPGPPELRSGATGRTLLQHIAEAAGCNAVMTRDGELDMRWIHTTADAALNPSPTWPGFTAVFETGIGSYRVAQISGVSIENPTSDGTEIVSVGSDTNPYRLTTNPFLIDETTATVVSRITPIKNRLAAFPSIRPVSVRCLCDWSIEAGDCLNFWYTPAGDGSQSSILMPIYRNTITYVGVAEVVRENSGSETRPPSAYAYGAATQQADLAQQQSAKASTGIRATRIICSTAAGTAAKTATAPNVKQSVGTLVAVVFTNGNTAETPTFSLNGLAALPIVNCYTGTNIASAAITTGMVALMMCDNTAWVLMNPKQGSFLANYTPSNAGQSLR